MDVTIGKMLKMLGGRYLSRVYHPLRNMFDWFDLMDITSEERENNGNVQRFKEHVRSLIEDRRREMKEPGFNIKGSFDFLTQLLSDDMYKDNDKMMMDECLTFIGAATQTTTFLLSNVVYYLMKNPEVLIKAKAEIKANLLSRLPKGASLAEDGVWENLLLSEENADTLPYML